MYMRLVQFKTKPDQLANSQQFYKDRVVPALQETRGCVYAGLMQSAQEIEEVVSMTLWSSKADAEAYEKSGLFQTLLEEARPMFADSSEWKMQLSKDLTLEYSPVPTEPTVTAYSTATDSPSSFPVEQSSQLYLRIVSLVIKAGKFEEFKNLYAKEVVPALKATKGCRHVFLMEPSIGGNEAISVSVWDSMEAANAYESSGQFGHLLAKVKHTFTDLYRWKMKLEQSQAHDHAVTSDDMHVKGYNVMVKSDFKF